MHIRFMLLDLLVSFHAYKVIARGLSKRLKKVLPFPVAENQMAFVRGRWTLDASLIANEIIDDWRVLKKSGLILKLDLEKVFDKVDWAFLDAIFKAKGFATLWRKWIYGCISSTNYSIFY